MNSLQGGSPVSTSHRSSQPVGVGQRYAAIFLVLLPDRPPEAAAVLLDVPCRLPVAVGTGAVVAAVVVGPLQVGAGVARRLLLFPRLSFIPPQYCSKSNNYFSNFGKKTRREFNEIHDEFGGWEELQPQ